MKTPIANNKRSLDGSALVLTAVLACFCGAVLATYLLVSQNEYFLVARSQTWNTSLALTEAGVEDALSFMNKYAGNFTMVTNWSTAESAAEDHWTKDGNTYTLHRVVNDSGDYYDVTIDNANPASPTMTSSGQAGFSLIASRRPFMMAAAGMQLAANTTVINRKI